MGTGKGSRLYFTKLWINTYNRLTHHHKLNNLIWNWSPNHFTSAKYENPTNRFPGIDYVDMVSVDDYYWEADGILSQGDYDLLKGLAQGKPMAIGEGFSKDDPVPSIDWILENRPEYRWFMIWDGENL